MKTRVDRLEKKSKCILKTYIHSANTYILITSHYIYYTGISMRWLLGTLGNSTEVMLLAQALPCTTRVIEANPSLQTDQTRGILVGRFKIQYDQFDNKLAAGPIPTFFSNKPEQSMAMLNDSPEFAFKCLQALVSRLLVRKELTR